MGKLRWRGGVVCVRAGLTPGGGMSAERIFGAIRMSEIPKDLGLTLACSLAGPPGAHQVAIRIVNENGDALPDQAAVVHVNHGERGAEAVFSLGGVAVTEYGVHLVQLWEGGDRVGQVEFEAVPKDVSPERRDPPHGGENRVRDKL